MPIQSQEVVAVPIEHVRVRTDAPFDDVIRRLEAETGLFDVAEVVRLATAHEPAHAVLAAINGMAGPSGFMRFLKADHGQVLRLEGRVATAVRYLIGHPLTAARMTQRAIGAALYAPLSLLVSSDELGTRLEYDRPSTLFAQFHDAEIAAVAHELDQKLEVLLQLISESNSTKED